MLKNKLGCGFSAFRAFPAAAVNFQPVAAELEAVAGGGGDQHVFNITASEVLGRAAVNAKEMMVMALMAQLIVEVAVFQQHPA